MSLTQNSDVKSYGGRQLQFTHPSTSCNCDMTFSIYLPKEAETGKVPLVYLLSGLTCTDDKDAFDFLERKPLVHDPQLLVGDFDPEDALTLIFKNSRQIGFAGVSKVGCANLTSKRESGAG